MRRLGVLVACSLLLVITGCSGGSATRPSSQSHAMSESQGSYPNRTVVVGFYAHFAPVSSSAEVNPASVNFNVHVGYEADLLSAMEAMDSLGLAFVREGIDAWDEIWLKPATPEFDLVGGGITILEDRTRDRAGNKVVEFTEPHVDFRQTLLVRAADAGRITDHDSLLGSDIIGALHDTTGEARLLQLIGVADGAGGLKAGTKIHTPGGVVVVPSDAALTISASAVSAELLDRERLLPADLGTPEVMFFGDTPSIPRGDEASVLASLREGAIDGFARGALGNALAAEQSGGEFVVTAYDDFVEQGAFVVDSFDTDLIERINTAVLWLTDSGNIGFSHWLADPAVFMNRADQWNSR